MDFGLEQYDRMAELLRSLKGNAIVSVNDSPEMRRAFRGFKVRRVTISYNIARERAGREPRGELIVRSW